MCFAYPNALALSLIDDRKDILLMFPVNKEILLIVELKLIMIDLLLGKITVDHTVF